MPWKAIMMTPEKWEAVLAECKLRNLSPTANVNSYGTAVFTGGMPQDEFEKILEEVEKQMEVRAKQPRLVVYPEFRALLPKLNGDQRTKLEVDLLTDGCRDPIVVWGDVILDGHNRYEICLKNGYPFETVSMELPNRRAAKLWIIHNQFGRRNLTTVQRADLAAKYEALLEKQPEGLRKRDVAAKSAGVAPETLAKYKRIKKDGDEGLKADVESGKTSINAANRELKEKKDLEAASGKTFNRTNDNIAWSGWSWNPFTGCLGPEGDGALCDYCYAARQAKRFPEIFHDFRPYFHADRLQAPFNTKIPETEKGLPGIQNVFLCSMGDLAYAKKSYIDMILDTLRRCEKERSRKAPKFPNWNFLLLTKVPAWLQTIEWPSNVWLGVTVDTQARVAPAVKALSEVEASVKFISVEPMAEAINFITGKTVGALGNGEKMAALASGKDFVNGLSYVDWLIIGGKTVPGRASEQPRWEWVEKILCQARVAGCKVFFKPNLTVTPQEYPYSYHE